MGGSGAEEFLTGFEGDAGSEAPGGVVAGEDIDDVVGVGVVLCVKECVVGRFVGAVGVASVIDEEEVVRESCCGVNRGGVGGSFI